MSTKPKSKANPIYDKILTKDQANYILNAISNGYHNRNDYPPFALSAIEDRQRFSNYVSKVIRDIAGG